MPFSTVLDCLELRINEQKVCGNTFRIMMYRIGKDTNVLPFWNSSKRKPWHVMPPVHRPCGGIQHPSSASWLWFLLCQYYLSCSQFMVSLYLFSMFVFFFNFYSYMFCFSAVYFLEDKRTFSNRREGALHS